MLPEQLTANDFKGYPPEARALAAAHLPLLRHLPLAFAPLLLRELIVYDWKFPAERRDLDRQFHYLSGFSDDETPNTLSAFARLKLAAALEQTDWINAPAVFSEQLSAHLWATHQIDAFRAAAVEYVEKANASEPDPVVPVHRLGIAVIGQGVASNNYRLFRKLRPLGTYYSNVRPSGGARILLDAVAKRAQDYAAPYGHWYIDGGAALAASQPVTQVSYAALAAPRAALQARMQKTYEASVFDPEAFRTMLAQIKPEEAGFASGGDPILSRFQLSLLTEGSGTQVFSTTFVQWAAREVLRRAQPVTVFARFAPRQREKPMNELLAETQHKPELDPQGSLVDADMGAWYTWLNLQRLPGADKAAFLAWFEEGREAVLISPQHGKGIQAPGPVDLSDLVSSVV
jgi:hypothetical protein